MIKIEELSHSIGRNQVLTDVTCQIETGGITALIGPNGAGKSTLLNLIARQAKRQSGRIEIDGLDLDTVSANDFAKRLASVAQEVGVASRIRVEELMRFGRWPHAQGRLTDADLAIVDSALEDFDLKPLANRFLDELSGGQKQRAFIAMAVAQDTPWLLLDEPLNNLDTSYAKDLMKLLWNQTRGDTPKSVVIVIHEVNYAAAWADQVLALKSGQVFAEGRAKNVIQSETLSQLYDTSIEVRQSNGALFVSHYS